MLRLIFFVCFGVGVGYTVISFLLGHLLDFAGFGDGDLDIGDASADFDTGDLDFGDIGGMDADGVGEFGLGGAANISPFKPVTIALFLTVFGGVGLILLNADAMLQWYFILSLAAVAGLCFSYLLFRYIYVPLKRFENTSSVSVNSLTGHTARVTLTIPQGGFGKISYAINGNSYGAPAKSDNGCEIICGNIVEILYVTKNVFYVKQTNIEEEIVNVYRN